MQEELRQQAEVQAKSVALEYEMPRPTKRVAFIDLVVRGAALHGLLTVLYLALHLGANRVRYILFAPLYLLDNYGLLSAYYRSGVVSRLIVDLTMIVANSVLYGVAAAFVIRGVCWLKRRRMHRI